MAGVDPDFELFFEQMYPRAAGVAFQLTLDRRTAEDVASEAFARALARWGRVGRMPYRDAWVLRVASNLALDIVRRKPPRVEVNQVTPDVSDQATLSVALSNALAALPRRQRQTIVLRFLAGMTESEAAAVLGTAPGTVGVQTRRGLAALRRELGTDALALRRALPGCSPPRATRVNRARAIASRSRLL